MKKFDIKIEAKKIVFIYDSFATTISDIIYLSKSLFDHTGNPYILDFEKILTLFDNSKFTCEVEPNPGRNTIVIKLPNNELKDNIIDFNNAKNLYT